MCKEYRTLPTVGGVLQQPSEYMLRLEKVLDAVQAAEKLEQKKLESKERAKKLGTEIE